MGRNTWNEYCEEFHQVIEKKGEPLYLRIEVTDAFDFDIFLELRRSASRNIPVLYHSTFGSRQLRYLEFEKFSAEKKRTGRKLTKEEIEDMLPLQHFLRFQYIDEELLAAVKAAFEKAEGIDYTQSRGFGLDGYTVDIYSYIGKGARFHYWVNLPQEYVYITKAVSLLADYLPRTDRMRLQPEVASREFTEEDRVRLEQFISELSGQPENP